MIANAFNDCGWRYSRDASLALALITQFLEHFIDAPYGVWLFWFSSLCLLVSLASAVVYFKGYRK